MHGIAPEKRFQLLANNAIEHAMIVMDADGIIVDWSTGAARLLGWSAEEAVGQPATLIYTPEDVQTDAHRNELNTAVTLGRSSDVRWHQRKDGSVVFCDGVVSKILAEDGRTLLGFGKIMREAYSEQRNRSGKASSADSEQRSFLGAVLESVENGIVACDNQGRLTFFNEAARAIHGVEETDLPPDQWAGRYQLFRADGSALLSVAELPLYRALQGERVQATPILVQGADGSSRQVEVSGRPLRDAAGDILGAVISMNDVTALHDAQDALREVASEQGRRRVAEAAQARVRKAEEQLRVAAEAARLGIWTWNVEHDSGTWENEQMYRIFGLPPGSAIENGAQFVAERLDPDDVEAFRAALRASIEDGQRFHVVCRIRASGVDEIRWIELTGVTGATQSGVIIGTAADITERKQMEKTLEEARRRLTATLSAGEVATWVWDIQHDRIIGDANLTKLFGVEDSMMDGAPLATYFDPIHPDDVDHVSQEIQRAIDTGAPYRASYRIRQQDGSWRWVSVRGRLELDARGRPEFMAGVLLDVTSQRQAQDALRVAEERYRTLIASMDEAFAIVQVLVDDDGKPVDYRFEEVNRALEDQSGLVNAAGKTIREMVPDIESRWIELYGRVALQREPARFTEHSAAMGYWWDVYATPMGEPHERRLAILFTDVTAKKRAEESLRQLAADLSETNRRKTEFLATLAHELRNPLAPMRTGLDLLRMAGRNGQAAPAGQGNERVLDMMDRQLKQMVHLIDDLMDVSRINSGKIELKKERIDLREAIRNAVEAATPAVQAAGHVLAVELPAQALAVDADATRLAQILGNLLTNAVKYTPGGGRIRVALRQEDGAALVAISDTGLGIAAEERRHVFDMFSQVSRNMGRAQGGLGIGLSLVRSLVEMHGGTIGVESGGPGQGSTFTLTLPLPQDAVAALPAPRRDGAAAAGADAGLRIVVADDNVDAAFMLGSVLEAIGHRAEAVHDGLSAVRKIVADKPDLAIVDIGMPGLNGYEVAKQIRSLPEMAGTLLVALTGWGGELDRSRSDDAGFDAHLTKPAGLEELGGILERARARRA
ncbi:PAS domain S-box protein [Massilia sp. 9096]|uniref:hybrid sensor histidine kinase/response regulator n=1 Tax=Massilia sp. 9096 TaxID=1500894 RepID=UPI000691678D|nr:PAS domain S-box protein [Massilia sp. 9096]